MNQSAAALVLFLLFGTAVSFAQTASAPPPPGALVDVDGGQLYYEECGAGASAVVLLHDGVVNSAVLGRRLAELL